MRPWLKWTAWAVAAITGLGAVLAAGGFLWLRQSLPQTEGSVAIAGLSAPVEVLRDVQGLVTIRAESEADAFTALGFVHAQDRLAQMDLMRRMGAGRLSEVLGERTVKLDRLMRTLGLYRLAEGSLDHLSPETVAAVEAYAAGVNAYIEGPGLVLPPEFHLLRYRPEPWRPADSLVWGRLMALQLSGNWSDEALRLRLSARLTPEQIAFLWPVYPAGAPVATGEQAAFRGLEVPRPGEVLPWAWAPKDASNSWAVAGALTASGKPILANDIHLALSTPSQWYLVRIETPELTLAGATAPGIPFMIAGHNGRLAWAYTTTHSDTQDLFVERLSKEAPDSYDTPEGAWSFETREEEIAVRGGAPVRFTVRASRHGPVVSDLSPDLSAALPKDHVAALAWPALRPDDLSAEALLAMNRARDRDGFLAALGRFHSPQQNILYADRAGQIAFMAPARVPIRPQSDGRFPVAGWSGGHDWSGLIPFAEMPRALDPPSGRIVVANNKIVPDDYPYLIAADWPPAHRASRITALLDADAGAGPETHARMQMDTLSPAAGELLPLLLQAPAASPRAGRARELLAAWDLRMDRDRPEPLVYFAWMRTANRLLLADELGDHFAAFQRADADLLVKVLREGETWCDDVGTDAAEACPERISAALEEALGEVEARFGADMAAWRWGEAHVARFSSPILGNLPVIGRWFDVALETDGGQETVNRGGLSLRGPEDQLFEHRHAATYRAVYDLADLDRSRFMIAGGQSGNPLSPHYGNLAEAWRDGLYVMLNVDESAALRRLVLETR
jgi:penicillin amidase